MTEPVNCVFLVMASFDEQYKAFKRASGFKSINKLRPDDRIRFSVALSEVRFS